VVGSVPALPRPAGPEVVAVAVLTAAASIFFGIVPSPLLDLASDAGQALSGLS
jgi:hypothetical protein